GHFDPAVDIAHVEVAFDAFDRDGAVIDRAEPESRVLRHADREIDVHAVPIAPPLAGPPILRIATAPFRIRADANRICALRRVERDVPSRRSEPVPATGVD